ncbi:hypothetical protein [Nonomuraea indica]|uniref:hypothetical protein n=1 Tax=Nonomuraea indica TaxID=1581193 RepID=UPI000C7B22BA|nr:hypothetical protein [Nonomuraea indica]
MTVTDAAVLLRCTDREIRRLVIGGQFDHRLVEGGFDYEVTRDSVIQYAARVGRETAPDQPRLIPRDPANPAEAVLTHSDNYDYERERES